MLIKKKACISSKSQEQNDYKKLRSHGAFSSLKIEDDSGAQWIFIGSDAFTGFTPSHLEEHRMLREPITVEYEKSATGELKILSLSD